MPLWRGLCAVFYASRLGRPSLRPGRYFRLLFIGYFEGLSSERGIAWRVADSLSLRAFLDLDVTEAPPNHSTLSRTRRLIQGSSPRATQFPGPRSPGRSCRASPRGEAQAPLQFHDQPDLPPVEVRIR